MVAYLVHIGSAVELDGGQDGSVGHLGIGDMRIPLAGCLVDIIVQVAFHILEEGVNIRRLFDCLFNMSAVLQIEAHESSLFDNVLCTGFTVSIFLFTTFPYSFFPLIL